MPNNFFESTLSVATTRKIRNLELGVHCCMCNNIPSTSNRVIWSDHLTTNMEQKVNEENVCPQGKKNNNSSATLSVSMHKLEVERRQFLECQIQCLQSLDRLDAIVNEMVDFYPGANPELQEMALSPLA